MRYTKDVNDSHIFVECKNYNTDIGNPELDQLAGRFSSSRGRVGLLVCRSFEDRGLFVKRCRDTASDGRGWILGLGDAALTDLATEAATGSATRIDGLLKDRFEEIIM